MNSRYSLPDPDQYPDRDVVIYDGHCEICTAGVRRIEQLDRWGKVFGLSGRVAFLSLHDPRVSERYGDLSYDRLMEEMVVVNKGGGRYGGADAIRYLSRRLPLLWIFAPLLHLPGTLWLWRWMYRLVAKNRYRWNRHQCEGGTCSLHFPRKS